MVTGTQSRKQALISYSEDACVTMVLVSAICHIVQETLSTILMGPSQSNLLFPFSSRTYNYTTQIYTNFIMNNNQQLPLIPIPPRANGFRNRVSIPQASVSFAPMCDMKFIEFPSKQSSLFYRRLACLRLGQQVMVSWRQW